MKGNEPGLYQTGAGISLWAEWGGFGSCTCGAILHNVRNIPPWNAALKTTANIRGLAWYTMNQILGWGHCAWDHIFQVVSSLLD